MSVRPERGELRPRRRGRLYLPQQTQEPRTTVCATNVAFGDADNKLIEGNAPDSGGTNFHLFTNERIELDGDAATAISKGGWMVASAENQPVMSILATYEDRLVRQGGRWKFARREILGNIPVPRR